MANKVLLKKSSTTTKVPLVTDLDYGELAINYADGKLYYKTSSNTIKSFTEDSSVVTLTGTQTLTNKSLTSPTITSPTLSGGTINNTVIGGSTPAAITGTTITSSTGNVTAAVNLVSNFSSGDEGGEIQLNKPATGTTIVSGVTIDVYQNKVRIFESGGTNRGAYIDLSAASTSVGSNLLSGGGSASLPLVGTYSTIAEFGSSSITTETSVYSFAIATYRTAKYIIQVTNGTAYTSLEVLVSHNGTNAWIATNSNSYATNDPTAGSYFDGNYINLALREGDIQIGTINAGIRFYISAGNLIFAAVATSGTISVKGQVTLIKV